MANQFSNAIYKIPRRFGTPRTANQYTCVKETAQDDRLGAQNNVFNVIGSASDYNQVQVFEPIFKPSNFLGSSPLMNAFYTHYDQFRCRSVKVEFTSVLVGASSKAPRVETAIWWCPNHQQEDSEVAGGDAPGYQYWTQLRESTHVSYIGHSPYRRFAIDYVPQQIDQDAVVDKDTEGKIDVELTYSDMPAGWMATSETNKTAQFRGPYVHFRRPFLGAGAQEVIVDSMSVVYTVIWEFRNADTDN